MVLKKSNVLARLKQMKERAEDPEDTGIKELLPMAILDTLLDYINDPQIRKAVDEIPF